MRGVLLLACGCCWLPTQATASGADHLAAADLERSLLADVADGTLDHFSLSAAALIAAGVRDLQEIRDFDLEMDLHYAEWARPQGTELGSHHARKTAEDLLAFLHDRILTGTYRREGWDLREALATGEFNCLTASMLYYDLAQRTELEIVAIQLPAHVALLVLDDEEDYLIETTLGAGVRQHISQPRERRLSAVELIGLVYFNRGVEALESGELAAAVRWNRSAQLLDPTSSEVSGNLAASINRSAWVATQRGDFSEALELLELGIGWLPRQGSLQRNRVKVARRWILALLQDEPLHQLMESSEATRGSSPATRLAR